jgi:outer membrane protein
MRAKTIKVIFAALPALCFACSVFSQTAVLTVEEAVKDALRNNYAVEIASAEVEIAKNNNTPGNAGMLPHANSNASNYWSNSNIDQQLSSGASIERSGVTGQGFNVSAGLGWTLFDGTRMFVAKEKLNLLVQSSEFGYRYAVEELVYRVMSLYYEVIRQNQQVAATENLIGLYEKRLEVATLRKQAGSASDVDILQAHVDLNMQQANLMKQKTQRENLSMDFAKTVWNNPTQSFFLPDTIGLTGFVSEAELKKKALSDNTGLMASGLNTDIARLNVKEIRASRYPKLGFGAQYSFAKTESGAGYMLSNKNYGFNYGFNLSLPIFDGFTLNRNIRNAKIREKISRAAFNDISLEVELAFLKVYNNYKNNLAIISMETRNMESAVFTLEVATERYALGNISDIQFKEVQKSYEEAQLRLINAVYEARINELDLMRLAGTLLQ